jgi:hypothetical protein
MLLYMMLLEGKIRQSHNISLQLVQGLVLE